MGVAPILLVGPFVAAVGLVAVFFVMRHRSVQEKSMYSARRSQIERKVRAARQRTLAPAGRHAEKEAPPTEQAFAPSGMEGKTAVPTATWGAPAPRTDAPPSPFAPSAPEQAWEVGPTVPPPPPSQPPPTPPPYRPQEPAYSPPPEPAYEPAPAETTWNPAPLETAVPTPVEPQVSTPAGGGASWSIVGENKASAEPVADKKSKKDKKAHTGSWELASGVAPGEDAGEEIKTPSAAIAIAQYAVLVVGLIMVLFGVLVMVANYHPT
jgi:hypothetical protein